jgi:hypothetical protein
MAGPFHARAGSHCPLCRVGQSVREAKRREKRDKREAAHRDALKAIDTLSPAARASGGAAAPLLPSVLAVTSLALTLGWLVLLRPVLLSAAGALVEWLVSSSIAGVCLQLRMTCMRFVHESVCLSVCLPACEVNPCRACLSDCRGFRTRDACGLRNWGGGG